MTKELDFCDRCGEDVPVEELVKFIAYAGSYEDGIPPEEEYLCRTCAENSEISRLTRYPNA